MVIKWLQGKLAAKREIIIITGLIISFSVFVKRGNSKDNVKKEFKYFKDTE